MATAKRPGAVECGAIWPVVAERNRNTPGCWAQGRVVGTLLGVQTFASTTRPGGSPAKGRMRRWMMIIGAPQHRHVSPARGVGVGVGVGIGIGGAAGGRSTSSCTNASSRLLLG